MRVPEAHVLDTSEIFSLNFSTPFPASIEERVLKTYECLRCHRFTSIFLVDTGRPLLIRSPSHARERRQGLA